MNYHRIINRPFQLHWAGWHTDTYELIRNGWEVSVEENPISDAIRFALRHQNLRIRGITNGITTFHYQDFIPDQIVSNMKLAQQIYISQIETQLPETYWKQINSAPYYLERPFNSIDDYHIFQPAPQEIIIPQKSVNELLEEIISKQDPKQKEIREQFLKERRYDKLKSHAQILSIAV